MIVSLCVIATALFLASSARAAGLLLADGGFGGALEIKEHNVQVTINNGVAVTKVAQVFHNKERRQVEALYTFPVPKGGSVANFSMWINGKEMVGEVLEKKRAREIYNGYKQLRQDPGLLEQNDFRSFEMRIFPIGPEADQKVEITYYQELDFDHDTATYVYPLASVTRKDLAAQTSGKFSIGVDFKSPIPITELTSPSHGAQFAMAKHSDNYWQANLEGTDGNLSKDVVLACRVSRPKTGLDLVTSRAEGQDGFFCLTVTAGKEVSEKQENMDYVFVLDISGSMGDAGKLLTAKDAVSAFLKELGDGDRFEVMTFNIKPELAFGQLESGSSANKERARQFLERKEAHGGTVLQPALVTAYKYAANDRPLNVLILSDGLTEQRERQVLLQGIRSRPGNTRVFCIGVGNDVNRPLLDQLAEDSGGLAAFISASDDFTRQAVAFRQKLVRPFATNLQLKVSGIEVVELEPAAIPNLYYGTPVRVYGRYRGGGVAEVTLRGSVKGVEFKETAQLEFPKKDPANPEINRLWASRRIDSLLKGGERLGDRSAVVPEIIRLGEDFSIVTEYTSFLVLENDSQYKQWKIERKNLASTGRDQQAQAKRRTALESIRDKALSNLGPQAVGDPVRSAPVQMAASQQPLSQSPPLVSQPVSQPPTRPNPSPSQGFDFKIGHGSSPVGPVGVLLSVWFLHKKRKAA